MDLKDSLTIYSSKENFDTLKENFSNIIPKNQIIILRADRDKHLFYNGTLEIFKYLNENFDEDTINILGDDEIYREISLHSKAHWIGVFLVSSVLTPIFTDVVSNYINEELNAEPKDEVALTINVVKKDKTTTSIDYRGDAEHLDKFFEEVNKLSEENESNKPITIKPINKHWWL